MDKNGQNRGRPPFYKTPEDLQAAIDSYFEYCDKGEQREIVTKQGEIITITEKIPPILPGLAYHLGFSDRHSLLDYKDKPEFTAAVMRARLRIEGNNLSGGMKGIYEARSNNLNLASNYGYSTKESIEHSGPGGGPIEYTDTERAARLAAILGAVKGRKAAEGG